MIISFYIDVDVDVIYDATQQAISSHSIHNTHHNKQKQACEAMYYIEQKAD
jgi:hypothetical protein